MKKVDVEDIKAYGNFAVILRCLLAKNNMTQGDLAEAVGMSEATITHYVKGKYTPSQKNLAKIAKCLNVTPQAFYGTVEEYTPYLNSSETRFAMRLTSLLKEKNVTQEQLAKAVGVSRQTVSYYANGKQLPMTDVMVKIAKFFDTSVESFLEDPSKQMDKPFDMKLYVTRMPENKYECKFHKWGMSYTSNGCEETHECKFGGDCDFKDGKCSRINALKGSNES